MYREAQTPNIFLNRFKNSIGARADSASAFFVIVLLQDYTVHQELSFTVKSPHPTLVEYSCNHFATSTFTYI